MLTKEETDTLYQIARLLDTGLDRAELELLVELVLDGAHPEARHWPRAIPAMFWDSNNMASRVPVF